MMNSTAAGHGQSQRLCGATSVNSTYNTRLTWELIDSGHFTSLRVESSGVCVCAGEFVCGLCVCVGVCVGVYLLCALTAVAQKECPLGPPVVWLCTRSAASLL